LGHPQAHAEADPERAVRRPASSWDLEFGQRTRTVPHGAGSTAGQRGASGKVTRQTKNHFLPEDTHVSKERVSELQLREVGVLIEALSNRVGSLSNRVERMQLNVLRRFDRIQNQLRIQNMLPTRYDECEETENPEPQSEELEQLRRERGRLAQELRDERDPQFLTAGKMMRSRSQAKEE